MCAIIQPNDWGYKWRPWAYLLVLGSIPLYMQTGNVHFGTFFVFLPLRCPPSCRCTEVAITTVTFHADWSPQIFKQSQHEWEIALKNTCELGTGAWIYTDSYLKYDSLLGAVGYLYGQYTTHVEELTRRFWVFRRTMATNTIDYYSHLGSYMGNRLIYIRELTRRTWVFRRTIASNTRVN